MNIREIAMSKLNGYKIKKNTMFIRTCPFCNDDNYNFEYSMKNLKYVCNSCSSFGDTEDLKTQLGVSDIYLNKMVEIVWKKENQKSIGIADDLDIDMKKKIDFYADIHTLDRDNVVVDLKGEYIVFVHLDEDRRTKALKQITLKEEKYNGNCLNSLWNMECVKEEEIIITLSELDALTLLDLGLTNVVATGLKKDLNFIQEHYDYLENKKKIVVVGNKEDLEGVSHDLCHRLGIQKVFLVEYDSKTIRDEIENGNHTLIEQLKDLTNFTVDVTNVVDLIDIQDNIHDNIVIGSGERAVDLLLGGIRMGELTIYTGLPASGKSTLLNQMIISFRDNNEASLTFSGEFKTSMLKKKLIEMSAGAKNLRIFSNKFNEKIKEREIISDKIKQKIEKWLKGYIKVFEYDLLAESDKLLKAIEEEYKRRGTRIFVIDNLMTVSLPDTDSKYDAQKDFVVKLKHLTKMYPIHILLVAHPKKGAEKEADMFSISGASEISNLADNIIFLRRLEIKEIEDIFRKTGKKASVEIKLLKDRHHGRLGAKTYIDYDSDSGRVYHIVESPKKVYGWEHE